jgi:hypothetical protein
MRTPEEVVTRLQWGRHLEGSDVAALRVDAGEDVADGAVFACGIHALEDDEEGLGLVGVEGVLEVGEEGAVLDEDGRGRLFGLEAACV